LELMDIFKMYATKADFVLSEDASDKMLEIFERLYEKRNKSFGNARVARNLFEKIIERQASRIVQIPKLTKEI
jgi:stage V sporulation protein K